MKKGKIIFIILCAFLLIMTGCGANADKITGYIEKLEFKRAYDYYTDKIKESDDRDDIDDDICSAMDGLYENLLNKYSMGEFDTNAIKYLQKLAEKASFDESAEYLDFKSKISIIDASASSYKSGLNYYKNNDYSSAISCFEMVSNLDVAHYDDAKSKMEECKKSVANDKSESIRNLISSGNYYEAIQQIDDLSFTDNETATQLASELETALSASADEKINSYFANFDYNGAYDYLKNLCNDYHLNSFESRLSGLENEFVQYSISAAEVNAANNNYEAASAIIQQAITNVGEDNENLNAAYNKYCSHLPIYITDMAYMSCTNNVKKQDNLKDNVGNLYHNGLIMYRDYDTLGDKGRYGEGSAEYYIQGNYKTFTGIIAVPSGYENKTWSAYFEIYGDGVLLFASPLMANTSFPTPFAIDVTGINILKISYPESNESADMATIYDGLLTPVETIPETTIAAEVTPVQ